jgi:hypothetical protein
METDKIYFVSFFGEKIFSQSIDHKYTKIRHNQKKMRKNVITEEK